MENNTRFNSINSYLRKVFGRKTVKLSIDGGFTCPNRDGTLGTGGCAFCSPDGSGEMASDIDGQIELLSKNGRMLPTLGISRAIRTPMSLWKISAENTTRFCRTPAFPE